MVTIYNGQLRIANATSGGAHKAAWANFISRLVDLKQLWQIVKQLWLYSTYKKI